MYLLEIILSQMLPTWVITVVGPALGYVIGRMVYESLRDVVVDHIFRPIILDDVEKWQAYQMKMLKWVLSLRYHQDAIKEGRHSVAMEMPPEPNISRNGFWRALVKLIGRRKARTLNYKRCSKNETDVVWRLINGIIEKHGYDEAERIVGGVWRDANVRISYREKMRKNASKNGVFRQSSKSSTRDIWRDVENVVNQREKRTMAKRTQPRNVQPARKKRKTSFEHCGVTFTVAPAR